MKGLVGKKRTNKRRYGRDEREREGLTLEDTANKVVSLFHGCVSASVAMGTGKITSLLVVSVVLGWSFFLFFSPPPMQIPASAVTSRVSRADLFVCQLNSLMEIISLQINMIWGGNGTFLQTLTHTH